MIDHIKEENFLSGVGSVVDIFPNTNYRSLVSGKSVQEKIRQDWVLVGKNIQTATNQFIQDGAKTKR